MDAIGGGPERDEAPGDWLTVLLETAVRLGERGITATLAPELRLAAGMSYVANTCPARHLGDAAKLLGVGESDVIASLEAGDLKGRRIGTQWRITRTALAEFLQ